jgi:hypothetical protein
MERRSFVEWSVVAFGAPVNMPEATEERSELFELRTYTLKTSKQPLLDDYLSKAFIPAAKRLSAGPVGVFIEAPVKEEARVFVLIVHKNAAAAVTFAGHLAADEEYSKSAAEYLGAKAAESVYTRIESSLLNAIKGMPKLEGPDASKPRLFNLRIYESHNERAAAKKIEMFEKAELAIFRRVGLTPVFFATTVFGPAQPNLAYMLVFRDEAERKAAWDRFRVDPEWLKLRAIPEYADKEIVSKITNRILTPATYSEL